MSKYFYQPEPSTVQPILPLTFVLSSEENDKGDVKLVHKCIEDLTCPNSALSFTDYSVAECKRKGITFNALNINRDVRLGLDKEFDALAKRFDESINLKKEN